MKILLIIDNLGSGGAQNQLTMLASELKKNKHDVSVFAYYPNDFYKNRLTELKIPLCSVQKKGKLGIKVIMKLKELYNNNTYDRVISFLNTPNFYCVIAKVFAKHKPKVVVSYRSSTRFDRLNLLKLKQKEWVNVNADLIISNSRHEKDNWCIKYPRLNGKFFSAYNFVEFNKIKRKNNFQINKTILVVGKPRPLKNAEVLINALSKLIDKSIHVHWYGNKEFSNPKFNEHFNKLQKLIIQNDLENQWEWKGESNDIFNVYTEYDLLIHPSKLEGLPNVVCEAMAAGMPIFASNLLDHPTLLNHNKKLLFDPNDPDQLKEMIEHFYTLSDLKRKEIGDQLYNMAITLFNNETILRSYLK